MDNLECIAKSLKDKLEGKSLEISVKAFGRQIRNPNVQLLTLSFV